MNIEQAINQYVHDMNTICCEPKSYISVRGRARAFKLGCRELRTQKHDHLAVTYDTLGNAFVLTKQGRRLNLIGNEIATMSH